MSGFLYRGRGAASDPPNRFDRLAVDLEEEEQFERSESGRKTEYLVDASRSIIASNDSPDVGFSFSINPYRGCEHGCIYCYARPGHEFLGFSGGLDFETKILVKRDAPILLSRALTKPSWQPEVIAISGVTDPYQPIERKLGLTRSCLEVLAQFRNPVAIVTKNHLVTRDIDILGEMAHRKLAKVMISITSLKDAVIHKMEPRTSRPSRRLEAIRKLSSAGVPTGVMVAPVIPGLTDEEMPEILSAAASAGAVSASYIMLRLPGVVEELFLQWLQTHYPDRARKIENRLRSMRSGQLSDSRFGHRMKGEGEFGAAINTLFQTQVSRLGLNQAAPLSTDHFRRVGHGQGNLF